MSRTIELGRAVLESPSRHHQVWLKTLITLSPQQARTNLDHLSHAALLNLLTSGDAWVCRGNGMHMTLEIHFNGAKLSQSELGHLGKNIVEAPVWSQLNLKASVSIEDDQEHSTNIEGLLTINIIQACDKVDESPGWKHKILTDVPFTDVRAPEQICTIYLQSVGCSLEIFENRTPAGLKCPKRRKPTRQDKRDEQTRVDKTDPDILFDLTSSTTTIARTKGKDIRGNSVSSSPKPDKDLKRSVNKLDYEVSFESLAFQEPLNELGKLLDAALRLSVHQPLPRLSGYKVKANTFNETLSTIAPSLWKPGHLEALSQRARLMPTIRCALDRTAMAKVVPRTLWVKACELNRISSQPHVLDYAMDVMHGEGNDCVTSDVIYAQLWKRTQRELASGAVEPIQSFYTPGSYTVSLPELGEDDLAMFGVIGAQSGTERSHREDLPITAYGEALQTCTDPHALINKEDDNEGLLRFDNNLLQVSKGYRSSAPNRIHHEQPSITVTEDADANEMLPWPAAVELEKTSGT